MKKLFLSIALLPVTVFAQKEITINEGQRPFSKGNYTSFQVEIPQTNLKETEKDWMKYLRNDSKEKPENINGEIITPGAINKNVNPAPFAVYSKLLETPTGVIVTAWLALNDSVFISKELNAGQSIAAQKYLRDFAIEEYREAVKEEIADEKGKLKKLENELEDYIKSEEKSVKRISEHKRSIERNQTAISTNKSDQKIKAEQIATQKGKVIEAKKISADAAKEQEKILKEYESDLKKLERENEKLNKEIDNCNKDIREEERNIDKSKVNQKLKQSEIETQKATVKAVEKKLENIR